MNIKKHPSELDEELENEEEKILKQIDETVREEEEMLSELIKINTEIDSNIDTVIGLYDTTICNTGKIGYLFTNDAVFTKN